MAKASAPLGCTNSDLPHRSRRGCNFSLTERRHTSALLFHYVFALV